MYLIRNFLSKKNAFDNTQPETFVIANKVFESKRHFLLQLLHSKDKLLLKIKKSIHFKKKIDR